MRVRGGLLLRRAATGASGTATANLSSRWLHLGVLAVCAALAGMRVVAAQPGAPDLLSVDFPVLTSRIAQDEPADYVVAIDVSGTMRPFWSTVIDGVTDFIAAVPDGDYVSVVAFGTGARYLVPPGAINERLRDSLIETLRALPPPDDQRTDLGRGLTLSLDELNRPAGSTLKFVFIFTDFKHDPPSGSAYLSRDPDEAAWQALRRRRQNELADKVVQVSALFLPLEAGTGVDFPLVQSVFPEAEEVRIPDAENLASWFERRKAEIARDKLRLRVSEDLRQPVLTIEGTEVRTGWLSTTGSIIALVSARPGRLVDVPAVRITPRMTSLDGPPGLEPAAGATVPVDPAAADLTPVTIARVPITNPPLIRRVRDVPLAYTLDVVQLPEPASEVTRLNLPDALLLQEVAAQAMVALPLGLIPLPLAVGGGIVALTLAGLVAYGRRPEYVVGTLTVVGQTPHRIRPGSRKTEIKVGNLDAKDGFPLRGVTWQLQVRSARPGDGSGLTRGTHVRLTGATGRLSHGGRTTQIASNWTPLPRGSAIDVGQTRVNWN